VDHVAFENPDGSKVLVLTNAGAAKNVQLKMAGKVAEVALQVGSVSSLSF
jgi:O-glycosyl hydrolase